MINIVPIEWLLRATLWCWELINCRGFVVFTCGLIMVYAAGYSGWRCFLEDDVD